MSVSDRDSANDSSSDHFRLLDKKDTGLDDTPSEASVSPVFDDRTRDFFEIITDLSEDSEEPASRQPQGSPSGGAAIHHTFGRFELRRQLGAGGCGSVFLAYDPKLRRDVALKLPNLKVVGSPRTRVRFLREARAVANLGHPNIVQVHEVDYVGAIPYIVATLCNGPSLAVWLAGQLRCGAKVDPRIAADWMIQLAAAIECAHQHGVVHRDIKPGNILLRIDGAVDDPSRFVPMLTDFGFARIIHTETEFTQTGAVLGTLTHLAPEQAHDPNCEIGPAVDIYSLGVVLYELLTGVLPIHGQNPVQLIQRLLHEDPANPRAIRPEIPKDLEAICLQCLAKSPGDRYASAGALRDDLRRYLRGDVVQARPVGPTRRLARKAVQMRFSWKPVLAILFGLSATAFLAVVLWIQLGFKNQSIRNLIQKSQTSHQRLAELQSAREQTLRTGYAADLQEASRRWARASEHLGENPSITADVERLLQPYLPLPNGVDVRGPEWHLLWNASHPAERSPNWKQRMAIPAHDAEVFGLSFAHDGRRIASGSADRQVRIWDVTTGDLLQTLDGHTDDVNWTSWSADDRLVASAGDDQTVRVWDVESGQAVAVLRGFKGWTYTSEFSTDGKRIAASDHTGLMKIWDAADFSELHSIQAHNDRIRYLAWSPDGQTLTTVSDDSTIKIWDADSVTQQQLIVFGETNRQSVTVAYSTDSRLIAIGGETNHDLNYDGALVVVDVDSGRQVAKTIAHESRIRTLSFVPGRSLIVSTSDDRHVVAWDLVTGQQWEPIPRLSSRSRRLVFSTDGSKLAVGHEDGSFRIWDTRAGSEWTQVFSSTGDIVCAEPIRHTNEVIAGIRERDANRLTRWDLRSAFPIAKASQPCDQMHAGRVAPESGALLVCTQTPEHSRIGIADIDSLEIRGQLLDAAAQRQLRDYQRIRAVVAPGGRSILPMVFNPQNADGSRRWELVFFDRHANQVVSQFSNWAHPSNYCPVAVSPDDELVAIGHHLGFEKWQLHLYDVRTQSQIGVIPDLGRFIASFGPDGLLAIGEHHGQIGIWNARTQEKLSSLSIGDEQLAGLGFYPGGNRLIAATYAEMVILTVPLGHALCRLAMPNGGVVDLGRNTILGTTVDGSILAAVRIGGHDSLIAWRPQAQ